MLLRKNKFGIKNSSREQFDVEISYSGNAKKNQESEQLSYADS